MSSTPRDDVAAEPTPPGVVASSSDSSSPASTTEELDEIDRGLVALVPALVGQDPSMNVLLTGGSRGIGAASARRLAEPGWDVAIGYRSDERRASQVVGVVQQLGHRTIAVRAHVSREDEVVSMFQEVDRHLGPLDALVNSAGMVAARRLLEDMDAERLERMMAVNVVGSFLCAREAVRRMSRRHGGAGGAIVTVSSGAARIGSPGEFVDYAASKKAVETMTIGLAKEVGSDGIRVNTVRPGIIDTEIHGRSGQPDKAERLASTIPELQGDAH